MRLRWDNGIYEIYWRLVLDGLLAPEALQHVEHLGLVLGRAHRTGRPHLHGRVVAADGSNVQVPQHLGEVLAAIGLKAGDNLGREADIAVLQIVDDPVTLHSQGGIAEAMHNQAGNGQRLGSEARVWTCSKIWIFGGLRLGLDWLGKS